MANTPTTSHDMGQVRSDEGSIPARNSYMRVRGKVSYQRIKKRFTTWCGHSQGLIMPPFL